MRGACTERSEVKQSPLNKCHQVSRMCFYERYALWPPLLFGGASAVCETPTPSMARCLYRAMRGACTERSEVKQSPLNKCHPVSRLFFMSDMRAKRSNLTLVRWGLLRPARNAGLLMIDWLIFRQVLNPLKNSVSSVFSVVKIFLLITRMSFQNEMCAALWSYSQ